MEQKTEASQAVTIEFALRQIIEADDNHALTQQLIDIGRAALKAQPAPAIAAKPAKYEQRFVSPQGMAAVWHDAQAETFHRHRSNGDLGDGWVHEVRALYAGPPAPTEAPNFERALRSFSEKLHASQVPMAPELSKVISENLWDLYAGDDEAPTEAAQGEDSARLSIPVSAYLWLMGAGGDAFAQPLQAGAFWWRDTFNNLAGLDMMEVIRQDRARASAETGGVKP